MMVVRNSDWVISSNEQHEMEAFFSAYNYECGGILCSAHEGHIDSFFPDRTEIGHNNIYHPNTDYLNAIISNLPEEVRVCGLIHSHLDNEKLSLADIDFCETLMNTNGLRSFVMGLYIQLTGAIRLYECIIDSQDDQ